VPAPKRQDAVLFPTVQFAIFFCVVLTISWALMSRPRAWKPFILAVSYLFYAAANWRFCVLLAALTLFNQAAAVLIARADSARRSKQILAAAVVLDLGVLGVFKYYGFFVQDVGDLLDTVGLGLPLPLLSLALPIGVSFFTFQAISYVVDVRRGLLPPASTLDFAIYLTFFPHLVAGPIVRAREFIPQLATPRKRSDVPVGAAVTLIAVGLVKKVAIADFLAREVVDPVFAVPQAYAAADVALAAYAYAAQIYCDFSGYTDIAIGLALLMGFVFPQNFDRPYASVSLREFWRRWHITLSRYLRDFLYIPLGGNRKGPVRTYVNLLVTMTLGGLWHGAAWTFVLWGALHGTGLAAEHAIGERRLARIPRWLRWFVVLQFVVLGWILFRSPDIASAVEFLGQLTQPGPATLWTVPVVAAVAGVLLVQLVPPDWRGRVRAWVQRRHPVTLGLGLASVILLVGATVPSQGVPPFIYFQF
jgi:D-alanyl-lipoteichoic acid acyltransferase DltB (MBOAT superfamily)